MKKTLTLLMFALFGTGLLVAQIPNDSPIPVVFKISSADGYNAQFDYSSVVDGVTWGVDTLVQTVSGQLVWAYDIDSLGNQADSLLCDSTIMDLTGKIALIRRGDCNFSLKMFHAQQNGAIGSIIVNNLYDIDGGGLVNMGAGDFGLDVNIPGIFITRDDGDKIIQKLDAGIEVTATFEVKSFGGQIYSYCYQTPKDGIVPLKDIGVTFINTDGDMTIPSLTVNAAITDPNGQTTTLSQEVTNLVPLSVNSIVFEDSYTPSAEGDYSVVFSNSLNTETLDGEFSISDYTYAQDNNVIDTTSSLGVFNGTIEPDSAGFVNANFTYDFGNFYRTGPNEATATHVTFVLGSYNELWTGDPEADVFQIRIYDADPDGNGTVPDVTNYDSLNETTLINLPIGGADYLLDGETPNFTQVTVELDDPLTLQANKIYLVMVQYNGLSAGIGIPPKPALGQGTDKNVAGGLSSARFGDRFYRDGWGTNFAKFAVRLHLDGYGTGTGTEEPLDKSKISLSPNPATDVVRLQFDLDKPAEDVTVRIMDFNGRLIRTEQLENVQKGTYGINVSDLSNGAYFMTVVTPEGFRSKKFQVLR